MNGETESETPSGTARSALEPISFAAALESLPKKDLIRLITAVGFPPKRSQDRRRSLLANTLSGYADKITIIIDWDSRMPNPQDNQDNQQEP